MTYHVLNGDSLAHTFPKAFIEGEVIVMREALIDGNLEGNSLSEFWKSRAAYIRVSDSEYQHKVVSELDKILRAPDNSTFNLWFEFDLFCQVNMWFVVSIIRNLLINKKVYFVSTSYLEKDNQQFWNGFGPAKANDLITCYTNRVALNDLDLQLGQDLWQAYKNAEHEKLRILANTESTSFPYLPEIVQAQVERFPKDGSPGRPEKTLIDIMQHDSTDFNKIFREFWKREPIYGFGDTQLRYLYDKVISQA